MAHIDYTPSPIVGEFIRSYRAAELFYSFIVGPVGSAKTTGAMFKIPYMASLQRKSPVDGIRRTRCVVVRNTASQLRDTTISSFNYWFKDGVAGKWRATDKTFLLKFDDVECEVMFRPLDTPDDVSRVLSLETTFVVLDEFVQIAPEIVEALSGRCSRYPPQIEGGATNWGMWGASNPGVEDSWWHDFLIEKKPDNVEYFHQPSGLSPQAENLGNLAPYIEGDNSYYRNLMIGKSQSWIEVFINANWGFSVSGKPVIPMFNRKLHVPTEKLIPNKFLPLVVGYDPGVRHSAMVIGQQDLYGRLHVFDELVMEGYGAARTCNDRLIPLLNAKYRGFEVIIAPDPAANSRSANNETSVTDVLREQRFKKYWTIKIGDTNLIAPRLAAIDNFISRRTEKGEALAISGDCRALIKALGNGWIYGQTKAGSGEKETPEKNIHSHIGDAFGYLCQFFVENGARHSRNQQRGPIPQFPNRYIMR
ncbi:MAG: hypothetical protein ACYC36_02435 [Bellilinea sp.]